MPSANEWGNITFSFEPRRIGLPPHAARASLAAAASLSARAQISQLLETFWIAAGFVRRIESMTSRTGRGLALESSSTKACNTFVTGSFGSKDRTRARIDFDSE